MKIALDAGHGARIDSHHTGAAASSLVEDEIALDFVRRIGHHLKLAGHQTVYTRSDDKLIALPARGKKAISERCNMFISIHCNAGPPCAEGVEAFVAKGDERSAELAEALVEAIAGKGMSRRGVKWDSQSQYSKLKVLRDTYRHMPAVLLEIGFLTNARDASLLKDKLFREVVSVEIAKACARDS
ncbi:MAG: N-acetylmuramoyl-L-alanine amidase family protein [Armatimonadota bacterium]